MAEPTSVRQGYLDKFLWTGGSFLVSALLKFGLNIILAHLLAPQIMGVLVVVNAVRLGVDLLTDVGVEQNIVHHPDGLEPEFRSTAWTMQLIRGALLTIIFLVAAPLLAQAYHIDVRVFLLAALSPLIGGAHSIAIFALIKKVEVRQRNLFELRAEGLSFAVQILLAAWLRSVWAPVIGIVLASMIRTALSYTLPGAREQLRFSWSVAARILDFGKWIAITSLVMYGASNLDRLYLGKVAALSLLGTYGIARAIAELPTNLARRMSYQIIFPALAGTAGEDRVARMAGVARSRTLFAMGSCVAIALAASISDLLIGLVYDYRYLQAGWMLEILLLGAIFAVLSNLNEALLLTAGRPRYSTEANAMRLATLALLLPLGYHFGGFLGAVIAVASVEPFHYGFIALGLARVRMQFWRADALILATSLAAFLVVLAIRAECGLGSPFTGLRFAA